MSQAELRKYDTEYLMFNSQLSETIIISESNMKLNCSDASKLETITRRRPLCWFGYVLTEVYSLLDKFLRSFHRKYFYGSNDLTNSVKALNESG